MRLQGLQELAGIALVALILPLSSTWRHQTQESPLNVGYSTLFGGPGADDCDAIAIDNAGAVYLGCHSDSDGLPGPGVPSRTRGDFDAFVVKLSADGRRILYRTQLGGSLWDGVQGLAVSSGGDIYAVGATYSPGLRTTPGAAQPEHAGGGDDAFVARLDRNGEVLQLTYLGGGGRDDAMGVTVDRDGGVYVVGRTTSLDFPVSGDAIQPTRAGGSDAFLTKLDPSGGIAYSTYLGGAGDDDAQAVELDAYGNVHIVGATESSDFPMVRPTQDAHGGGRDGFLTVLSHSADEVRFSTVLGGSGDDEVNSLSLAAGGEIYMTGLTRSDDLGVTPQAFQPSLAGGSDAFVLMLEPIGSAVAYLSYLGGRGDESRARVTIGSKGAVFLVGATGSHDFPLVEPLYTELGGRSSGYVVAVGTNGSDLVFSTYFGGGGVDAFEGSAAHPDGGVVVTGLTGSPDMPVVGGLGFEYAGGRGDIPVVRFDITAR